MTQANNRQGQGGGELVPFIEGGAAPRLDRVARWGGTESNRARAARGALPLTTWDGLPVPFERVDAGHHEARRGRTVGIDHASGPDFTATQRVVVTPDGQRHAVNVPSQADLDGAKRAAPAQPDPAPGQVWLPPPSASPMPPTDPDGTLTIASIDDYGHWVRFVGGEGIEHCAMTMGAQGWTCIGVATPHGRVMVGDGWRRAPDHEFTVTAIASEDGEPWIKVRYAGGQQDHDFDARNLWDCAGYHRTRYAPARAGERYRNREGGYMVAIQAGRDSAMDPAQWERLDPGTAATQTLASDLSAHEIIMDWIVSAEGIGHANGGVFTDCGRDGLTAIGLTGGGRDLRALFDAIGRALELPATRHACPFGAGLNVTVLRDEMLFTPTAETGIGSLFLSGDTRALCALRSTVGEAMATGRASLPQWGAKGPRVEVVREGGAMVAPVEAEPCEAPRYTPASGGADAWRWGVGE